MLNQAPLTIFYLMDMKYSTLYEAKKEGVALYVNKILTCTIRVVQSKVIEHVFECVTVELHKKKYIDTPTIWVSMGSAMGFD